MNEWLFVSFWPQWAKSLIMLRDFPGIGGGDNCLVGTRMLAFLTGRELQYVACVQICCVGSHRGSVPYG